MDLLDNVQSEVDEFLEAQRPTWPNEPTRCPVFACGEQLYRSFSSFSRHWSQKHKPDIQQFACVACHKLFYRRNDYTAHQRKKHAVVSPNTEGTSVPNELYIAPGGVLPYKADLREKVAAKRKQLATPGETLVSHEDTTTCRDQEFDDQRGENVFKKSKK